MIQVNSTHSNQAALYIKIQIATDRAKKMSSGARAAEQRTEIKYIKRRNHKTSFNRIVLRGGALKNASRAPGK